MALVEDSEGEHKVRPYMVMRSLLLSDTFPKTRIRVIPRDKGISGKFMVP